MTDYAPSRIANVRLAYPALPYGLSPRELAVLHEITRGFSDGEIAGSLGITKFTVNKHVGAILAKMNVRSRTGAAVRAIRDQMA
jgi:DNA-binding NarL/FixJ family response regulator